MMLTFKHFCDRPLWAAADGYDFNFLDCLSVAAINITAPFVAIKNITSSFPDWEMRELLPNLLALIVITTCAIAYPMTYWIYAIFVYFNCKRHARKYRTEKSEVARINLAEWRESCDRRFNG